MSRDETGEVNRGPIMEGFEGILILSWEQWATIEWFQGKKQKALALQNDDSGCAGNGLEWIKTTGRETCSINTAKRE